MTLRDRLRAFMGRPVLRESSAAALAGGGSSDEFMDLPLQERRDNAGAAVTARRESLSMPGVGLVDSDDHNYRRLSSGGKFKKRDLSPMAQDRMLEIAWFLYESNPFGRRLITCMTDIVVGEGVNFEAKDPRISEAAGKVWNHPINKLGERARELHNALGVNGELCLPVAVNDVSGVPSIGFIDPYQIERIEHRPDNILVPDYVVLKLEVGDTLPRKLKIVQQDPLTGLLFGDVFYFAINKLPNSLRGRSDYLPLADWLDLFDQYMFNEVERVRLLSAFVYDLEVKEANQATIDQRIADLGKIDSGEIFGHNEKEKLTAVSPALNSGDRSETARLLTIHIAGSLGMPITWFGWPDSTNATIQGQNDVAMKTPAARQREFGGFLNTILRFGIEQQRTKNPVLFRELSSDQFGIMMPEIAAKDIARVGQVLSQVVAALDTGMANKTMSRRVATMIELALVKHLGPGLDFKADDVMADADKEAEERQERADEMMAGMAAAAARNTPTGGGNTAAQAGRGIGPLGKRNPPIPDDVEDDD